MPPDLNKVTHVFLRVDALATTERRYAKDFKIQRNNNAIMVSVDRLKPAFVLRDDPSATDHTYSTHAEIAKQPNKRVHFSVLPRGE